MLVPGDKTASISTVSITCRLHGVDVAVTGQTRRWVQCWAAVPRGCSRFFLTGQRSKENKCSLHLRMFVMKQDELLIF